MDRGTIVYRGTACRTLIKHCRIIVYYEYPVDMIWHYNKGINIYMVKMFGYLIPEPLCDFADIR